MLSPEERDLKALFDALRDEELQHTTPYSRDRSPGRGRTMPVRFRLTIASLLMLLLSAVLVIVSRPSDSTPVPASLPIAEWKAPTDFLLLTPGQDLMRSAPRFGAVKGVSQ